ncbi:MAG: hypothetical protein JWM98_648 [Thermoleophilia bacterium]|nr:hypothetical protein [Thermoleophilia bacterium]
MPFAPAPSTPTPSPIQAPSALPGTLAGGPLTSGTLQQLTSLLAPAPGTEMARKVEEAHQISAFTATTGPPSAESMVAGELLFASLGGLDPTSQHIPRPSGLTSARYDIVPDAEVPGGADAFYDQTSRTIKVPESFVKDLLAVAVPELAGRPLDAQTLAIAQERLAPNRMPRMPGVAAPGDAAFAASLTPASRHRIATGMALFVHEFTHLRQDATGELAQFGSTLPANATDEQVRREYVRAVELPAQRAQEQVQLAAGEPPTQSGWLTMTASGQPLPEQQAVDNMVIARGTLDEDVTTGFRLPGFRLPGFRLPGFRLPGSELPGFRLPGSELPGFRLPGSELV